MKKLLALLLTTLLIGVASAANAEDQWKPPQPRDMWSDTRQYVLIADNSLRHTSVVWWQDSASGKGSVCLEAGVNLDCGSGAKGSIFGTVLLPYCGTITESCIEKLWVYQSGSAPAEAEYLRTTQSLQFKGNPQIGLPSGGGVSLFNAGLKHTGGSGLFGVAAKVQLSVNDGIVRISRIDVDVAGLNEVSRPNAGSHEILTPCLGVGDWVKNKLNCPTGGGSFEGNDRCFFVERGLCAIPQMFPENLRIGVQLKLSTKVSGWFSGRLKGPEISVSKVSAVYNTVKVDAEPVTTTRFYAETNTLAGDPDINTLLRPGDSFGHDALFTDFAATGPYTPAVISLLREKVRDTAAGVSTLWNFYSTGQAENGQNNCFADNSKVLGIVTTNAMAYLGTAPEFVNGFLQYKVAGLHYLPDGVTPVQGTYDLVMRSEVARCLYGFSSAPISATVEITGGETQQIATTTVVESNNWLKMSAYGFGFSEKVIKAKISQKRVRGSINCVRGKTVKKIVGVAPKCPIGYKQKW